MVKCYDFCDRYADDKSIGWKPATKTQQAPVYVDGVKRIANGNFIYATENMNDIINTRFATASLVILDNNYISIELALLGTFRLLRNKYTYKRHCDYE